MLILSQDVPCTGLIQSTSQQDPQRCTHSLIKNSQSGDMQGTAHSPLLTLEAIPPLPNPSPSLQNLEASTPVYTFYPMAQPRVATCQSQLHLSPRGSVRRRRKEESGRTFGLIRNVWVGRKGGGGKGGRERWR